MKRLTLVLLAACLSAFALAAAPAGARARFDTQVLALIPPPGYPALAYVARGLPLVATWPAPQRGVGRSRRNRDAPIR